MELLTLVQVNFSVDFQVWKAEADCGVNEEEYVEQGVHEEQHCAHKRSPRHLQGLLPGNLDAIHQ